MREYRITEGACRARGSGRSRDRGLCAGVSQPQAGGDRGQAPRPAIHRGLAQAKQYAGKIGARFTYSTNGLRIYGVDMVSGAEDDVAAYPSPQELWNRTFAVANDWRERFAAVLFGGQGRYVGSRYTRQRDQCGA